MRPGCRVALFVASLFVVLPARADAGATPTWLLARVRLTDPNLRATLDMLSLLSPIAVELRRCGLDPQKGLDEFELSISRKQLSVDLRGKLPVAAAHCALDLLRTRGLGVSILAPLKASATEGGVRISGPVAADAVPDEQPLHISPTALYGVSWRFGHAGARHQLDLEVTRDGVAKIQVTCADVGTARGFRGWLIDAIARAVRAGSLHGLEVEAGQNGQSGKIVSIRVKDAGIPLGLALRQSIVEAFNFPSDSMLPTLESGDHLFVAKGALAGSAQRGDLVAFMNPEGRMFTKRVAAIGGDRIELQGDQLSVNGKPVPQVLVGSYAYQNGVGRKEEVPLWRETQGHPYGVLHGAASSAGFSTQVPDGMVFVLGDNRPNPYDSRFFGSVARSAIIGRVTLVYFSIATDGSIRWDRIGIFVD